MLQALRLWYGRHKIICRAVAGLVAFYIVTGFVITPMVVRHILRNTIAQALGRSVETVSVRTNPFTFALRIKGLSIRAADGGNFVDAGDILINADPLHALFKWAVVIKSAVINQPRVRMIRTADGRLNFSDLLPASDNPAQGAAPAQSRPLRFILEEFQITAGQVEFVDQAQAEPFETKISDLMMSLGHLDTFPGAEPFFFRLSARTEANEQLRIDGRADVSPMTADMHAVLDNLDMVKYAPYYQPFINARLAQGRMGLEAGIQWSDKNQIAGGVGLSVSSLVLKDFSGEKILASLPRFNIEDGVVDFINRRIQLGRVTSKDVQLNVQRDNQGQLDLQAAFAPRTDGRARSGQPSDEPDALDRDTNWQVAVPQLSLLNCTIGFEDFLMAPVARIPLHHFDLTARNLSTQEQTHGRLNIQTQWAEQGALSVKGDLCLIPLQATLDMAAEAMDIRPLQPYLQQFVQLVVTAGEFNTQSQLRMVEEKSGMNIRITGQAALNNFEAVDAQKAELFSKWKSFYLTGIDLRTAPLKVSVEQVALADFYNRLIINADGTANIETIIGQRKDAAEEPKHAMNPSRAGEPSQRQDASPDGQPADFRLKKITLQGGQADFSDLHVKPNVRLAIKDLGGRISGLDNIEANKADVLLRGMVRGNIPLEIKGQVNPLIEKPFVDLSLNFPGVDLSPFAPYSSKYLGYRLEKGQLAVTLAYKIMDNKLAGQNRVQINQLVFGDPVPSPQAVKLPVRLAVSLLKDRQGNIDLDLPVQGDLDDPEFSIGGIILKMFVNLITDIVTAPFKMLGALFGGGDELAYLDFDPGQSDITAERVENLDTLAKVLFERPGLKLEIQGQVDPDKDSDAIRRLKFEVDLKAAKLKNMVSRGRKALPLEQITLTPQERTEMIVAAYDEAVFPKPRDEKGAFKPLDTQEMAKLLYTAIEVSADDLRLLAHQRASAAKDYLLAGGKVEAQRLFITEPEIGGGETSKAAQPRVKFNLQ